MANTEWGTALVKDICDLGRGRVISSVEIINNPGIFPVYSSQSTNKGEMGKINSYDFNGEYITWTTDGAYAGTVFYRKGKFNCTNVCGTLKAKNNKNISLHFLAYKLETLTKRYVSYVGNPKLMNDVMARILIDFPTSKPEQTKIAEILSTVDKAIEQTEAIIAKQQRIKTGLMQDLLTKGIDENGNIRSEKTHKFKDSPLGRIPEEWKVNRMEKWVLSSAFGPRFPSSAYSKNGNIATLRTTDLDSEGTINYNTMPLANLNENAFRPHLLKNGDLLISRSGTIGITSVFEKCSFPVLPGAFLIRFRLNTKKVNPFYLKNYFYLEKTKLRINDLAEGGVQKNLRGSEMLKMIIALPPKIEQDKIQSLFDNFFKNVNNFRNSYMKLVSLKTALMQDLLTGKVRVNKLLEKKEYS